VGLAAADPEIVELVEAARGGTHGVLDVAGAMSARVMAWPLGPGRARVLVAPRPEAIAKRAAAADLAAGVTHEVANALTAIAGWTRLAAAGGPLPERTRQALEIVQRSARDALGSARGLLATMRDAGRGTIAPNARDHTNVSLVVGEVLETLRPELEEAGIVLETDFAPEVWGSTPSATLRLIVSNLVRNAYEAISHGGSVHVAVRDHDDRICLSVADDGPGMSRHTLARAFDRYFTTKEHGTGLGLALVRDTVHDAGGRVEVESGRSRGTRFDVWLPAAGAPVLSARPPQVTASSGVHPRPALVQRSVLVVDDDEAMRSMVRTALELHGAQVHTAAGVTDALTYDLEFALVLIDLSLGDGRGDELLAELRTRGRVRHAIVVTGSPDLELAPAGEPDMILRKPFELDELTRAIEAVLDSGAVEAEG
jgi:signal transduction histidine kinase